MARRGKRVALWCVGVGGVVVVSLGVLNNGRVREQFYLYKLKQGDVESKKRAAERLREMGSVRAVPELFALVGTEGSAHFRVAIHKIASKRKKEVLRMALERLGDRTWQVRQAAAEALAWIGTEAAEAVPRLRGALDDREREVREAAGQALGKILGIDSAMMGLLVEYDSVVIGSIRRVGGVSGTRRSLRHFCALVVDAEEVLKGALRAGSSFKVYEHSMPDESGATVGGLPRKPMLWLLKMSDGKVTSHRRFALEDADGFREALAKVQSGQPEAGR